MPYKIAGQPGTWYEPGTRKGNATIAWRGQLPDGSWTELVTDSRHQSGAQAFVRRVLERWHRDTPPTSAAQAVMLEVAAHHYKAARARSDAERDRVDRIVDLVGKDVPVGAINQTHLTEAASKWRQQRRLERERAIAEGRQAFPLPSTPTVNRELTTPLRTVLNFAEEQGWRTKIVIRAVKPAEGEIPSLPRPAARDRDVEAILLEIDTRLAALTPTGKGRDLNYHRQRASLQALRGLIVVVHERGYRISEWLRWEWATVDLQAGLARILLSKPTRWQEFDLSPTAVAALAQVPTDRRGRVFPWGHRANVYNAVDKIGLHWRPHESRRAVVTAIIQQTGDPVLAQRFVSHASLKTTMRYRVVDPAETAAGIRTRGKR